MQTSWIWSALVRSKKPEGREVAFTQEYGKHPANWSRIGPKFGWYGKVNQKQGRFPNVYTVPFPCEQKRQVQFRSTFLTCWVSTGARKSILLTKLVTLSQYIRETLFSCQCFLIFRNKLLNFNLSELFFSNFITDVLISLTINFLPFGDGQCMLLIVWRFSACIFAFLAELKSYKMLFLESLKKS